MPDKRRGRPPKPLNPAASEAARLGAEIRRRRLARGLTQQALGDLIGCSAQQVSSVERATSPVSGPFVRACDAALDGRGALEELLPAVLLERMRQSRQDTELILAVEKLASEEVRLRPAARALVADILHRAPVVGGELRELAHRLTVA